MRSGTPSAPVYIDWTQRDTAIDPCISLWLYLHSQVSLLTIAGC